MDLRNKNVLVLFSGGIDSSACIHYYKHLGFNVEGLFVNYGQKSLKQEKKAINLLSAAFQIQTKIVKIDTNLLIFKGEIQGRNLFLISVALMNFQFSKGLISLGIHSGTNYIDCSKDFLNKTQEVINLYSSGNISLDCPFIEMSKREIFNFCNENDLPLHLTYSCENGAKYQPCGKCSSCKDLIALYEIQK